MEALRRLEGNVWASYSQFYVVDGERGAGSVGDVWDGRALERHLGVLDGLVAVATVGTTATPVVLEAWAAEPPLDDGWDHVAEASIDVQTGRVVLAEVEGPTELELGVEPGSYRVRVSGAGLDAASGYDRGDRWRVQLWPAPAGKPRVVRWWPPWDPSTVTPRPTTDRGRVLVGAEAEDARRRMTWQRSRGVAQLFEDADGVLWEHSALRDAHGAPQLEELNVAEAERRYGPRKEWGTELSRSLPDLLKAVGDTLRYQRGWRPSPDPTEPVIEGGRRVMPGNLAYNTVHRMTELASASGDTLFRDVDGSLWEWQIRARPARLVELTPDEARAKYGIG